MMVAVTGALIDNRPQTITSTAMTRQKFRTTSLVDPAIMVLFSVLREFL